MGTPGLIIDPMLRPEFLLNAKMLFLLDTSIASLKSL